MPAAGPTFDKERLKYEYEALEGLKAAGVYGVRGRPVRSSLLSLGISES